MLVGDPKSDVNAAVFATGVHGPHEKIRPPAYFVGPFEGRMMFGHHDGFAASRPSEEGSRTCPA